MKQIFQMSEISEALNLNLANKYFLLISFDRKNGRHASWLKVRWLHSQIQLMRHLCLMKHFMLHFNSFIVLRIFIVLIVTTVLPQVPLNVLLSSFCRCHFSGMSLPPFCSPVLKPNLKQKEIIEQKNNNFYVFRKLNNLKGTKYKRCCKSRILGET